MAKDVTVNFFRSAWKTLSTRIVHKLIVNESSSVSLSSFSIYGASLLVHRLTNSSSWLPWQMTVLSTHRRMTEMAWTDAIDGGQSARTLQVVGTSTANTSSLQLLQYCMLFGTCHWDPDWVCSTPLKWNQKKAFQLPGRWTLVRDGFIFLNAEWEWSHSLPSGCNCNGWWSCLRMCWWWCSSFFRRSNCKCAPFYTFCDALYHLLCWYSHSLTWNLHVSLKFAK